jgi:hypothetical protein
MFADGASALLTHAASSRIVDARWAASRWAWTMAREYVTSTSVEWIEYDASARALEIAFASGGIYRYLDVPSADCDALRAAESKGRFVNEVIKRRYRYVRVRPPL